ncbi:MHS family shikimate/dehydroshikimate transporter-like MFS transporter [Mycolicibacterium sp. 624]
MERARVAVDDEREKSPIKRVAAASLIGTTIEWYDFYIYGAASATIVGTLFFPGFSTLAGTLAAFSTFAVGFIARPLGGVFFGHFGDRIGRKRMLIVSLLVMGAATFAIGLLPTFDAIGVWAPIILVSLRFIQGFAVGGEWGGAVIMAVEHAPRNRRGFYGSWPQMGVPIGLLMSTGLFAMFSAMPDDDFRTWGWRVPFLLSIVLVAVGLFIRLRVIETPVFDKLQKQGAVAKIPFFELVRSNTKNVLLAGGIYLGHGVLFYVLSVFTLSWATTELGMPRSVFFTGIMIAAACQAALVPIFGRLSDSLGRRRTYAIGAALATVCAFPLYWMIGTGVPALVWTSVVVVLGVAHPMMYAPTAALYAEMFPPRVRYSGASVGYQIGGATVGFVPLFAASIVGWADGASWPISVLIIVSTVIGLISIYLVKTTYGDDFTGSGASSGAADLETLTKIAD